MTLWCYKPTTLIAALLMIHLPAEAALMDITRIFQSQPTLAYFQVCSGGGCAYQHTVGLDDEEWQSIQAIFAPHPDDNDVNNDGQVLSTALSIAASPAEIERQRVPQAIARFETLIGEKTNTSGDLAGTFHRMAGQLDCNDEAINTITYLRLLQMHGLLQHHVVTDIRLRNYFFSGWPHSAASMRDTSTREDFVVDSWFYDNGLPSVILPLTLWKSGFTPADSPLGR